CSTAWLPRRKRGGLSLNHCSSVRRRSDCLNSRRKKRPTSSRRFGATRNQRPRADEMNPAYEHQLLLTRRQLFGRTAAGIGTVALASLLNERLFAAGQAGTHFAPKAKRVIYLFMSGGPSHIDLFDYKPKLKEYHGKELPASVRMGQRVTGM